MAVIYPGRGVTASVGGRHLADAQQRGGDIVTAIDTALVVGGGTAGAAATIFLARGGVAVDLVESSPDVTALGSGIALHGNGLRVLDALGLLDGCVAQGYAFSTVAIRARDSRATVLAELESFRTGGPALPAALGMYRPDLARILMSAAQAAGVSTRFATTVGSTWQDEHGVGRPPCGGVPCRERRMSRRHRTGPSGENRPSSTGGRAWSGGGAGVPIRAPGARLPAGRSPRPCRGRWGLRSARAGWRARGEVQEQAGPLGHLDHRLGCAQHVPRLIEVCPLPAPLEPLGQEAAEIQPGGPGGAGVEQSRAPTGRAAADERSRRRAGECGRLTVADLCQPSDGGASAW
jgi:hypothetical protein